MVEERMLSEPDPASEEFQALASAVRAYDRLVQQAHKKPVSVDPVELLTALSRVGQASLVVVRHAGAL